MNLRKTMQWFESLQIPYLQNVVVVIDDAHATAKLSNLPGGVSLVVAIPSYSVPAQLDVNRASQVLYIFALSKLSDKERTPQGEITMMEQTLAVLSSLIEAVKEESSDSGLLFYGLHDAIEIEPIYNVFGGWDGYSCVIMA